MIEVPTALIFFAGALLLSLLPARAGAWVMPVVPVVALLHVLSLEPGASLALPFFGFEIEPLRVDRLSLAFGYIFCIAAIIAGVYGMRVMTRAERVAATLYAGSAVGVVFAGDLVSLFVFWEIKAVGSTFVVWAPGNEQSRAAGLRYVYAQVAGGSVLLGGLLVHFVDTGSLAFTAFDPSLGAVIMLVGILLSAAAPPMNAWLPDAYPRASVAGTVFLSAYTTKAAVYALARGFSGYEALIWIGVFMALFGVTYAVLENDIRRLLSYHIVSQVGFMVAAVGVGTEMAVNGAVAHAFAHIVYKGLLLMGTGAVLYAAGTASAADLGGLLRKMRWVFALYMVGAVSISGVPLFSGFVSKEMAVYGASTAGLTAVVVLLKVASVGTFLSTAIKLPYNTFGGPDRGIEPKPVPGSMYVAMGAAALINLAIGLAPGLLYGVLPFPVDYAPYSFHQVVETMQVLVFSGLGTWVLISWIKTYPSYTLDFDWFYRALPRYAVLAVRRRSAPAEEPAGAAPGWSERLPLRERIPALSGAASPVYPTWMLGAAILVSFVLVLGISLRV